MSVLGVDEVACELGVSPRRVRQMISDGVLVARRLGGVWVIEREHVGRVERHRRQVGRPWSPGSAWAVLALADGGEPDLAPVDRSRARKRLGSGLDRVVGRLGARSDRRWFYGHPAVLDRLGGDPQVVRGGVSAAGEHGAGVVSADRFEGYVRGGDLDRLVARFGLDGEAVRPNVLLRVVDDEVWPFQAGQRYAGRSVVAVDMLESDDSRVRRAGAELMDRA